MELTTRGGEIIGSFDQALAELDGLRLSHYEEANIRTIVETLGSKTERFFKTAIWPGSAMEDTFDGLINRLKSLGVNKELRNDLHDLRQLYNDAKHNPTQPIRLKQTIDSVTAAAVAMKSLVVMGLGTTAAPVETAVSRLLWLSAFDVYVGGVTEIYISLPLPEEDFATHLDLVWIKGSAWDSLKAELMATGCFYLGEEHFSPKVYTRFKEEEDFLRAGVWDGDYGKLVQIIANHEDRPNNEKLLPFLRRDHMYISVLSSIALAGVDVATGAVGPLAPEELTKAILAQADRRYAMPSERPWVLDTALGLAAMIDQIPFSVWKGLSGPYWNLWNPKQLITHVKSPDEKAIPYVIDDANRLVIV